MKYCGKLNFQEKSQNKTKSRKIVKIQTEAEVVPSSRLVEVEVEVGVEVWVQVEAGCDVEVGVEQ